MKEEYFLIYFGEDGISISKTDKQGVDKLLKEVIEDGIEHITEKFDAGKEDMYYMDGGSYPIYKTLIIKGSAILPKSIDTITKLEI